MLTLCTLEEFDAAYTILQASFPPEEYRPYAAQRALLERSDYRLLLHREEDGRPVALCAVYDIDGWCFLEHLAVTPAARCQGLGARSLHELSRHSAPICLEVELPTHELARRRIGFYQRCGFVYNEYPYVQPPMAEGLPPVPLRIMTYGRAITKTEFIALRDLLYHTVYRVREEDKELLL